eukprot:PhF_6_TR1575/c0_g1_i2/m.2865
MFLLRVAVASIVLGTIAVAIGMYLQHMEEREAKLSQPPQQPIEQKNEDNDANIRGPTGDPVRVGGRGAPSGMTVSSPIITLPASNYNDSADNLVVCEGRCQFSDRRKGLVDSETQVSVKYHEDGILITTYHVLGRYAASFPAFGIWAYDYSKDWNSIVNSMPAYSAINGSCLLDDSSKVRDWAHKFSYGTVTQDGCPPPPSTTTDEEGAVVVPSDPYTRWCEYAPVLSPKRPWIIHVIDCEYKFTARFSLADIKNNVNSLRNYFRVDEESGKVDDAVIIKGAVTVNHVKVRDVMKPMRGFSNSATDYTFEIRVPQAHWEAGHGKSDE